MIDVNVDQPLFRWFVDYTLEPTLEKLTTTFREAERRWDAVVKAELTAITVKTWLSHSDQKEVERRRELYDAARLNVTATIDLCRPARQQLEEAILAVVKKLHACLSATSGFSIVHQTTYAKLDVRCAYDLVKVIDDRTAANAGFIIGPESYETPIHERYDQFLQRTALRHLPAWRPQ